MTTRASTPPVTFTRPEWQAFRALRARYRRDADLFSDQEQAHLRFFRWLCQTGRLVP